MTQNLIKPELEAWLLQEREVNLAGNVEREGADTLIMRFIRFCGVEGSEV